MEQQDRGRTRASGCLVVYAFVSTAAYTRRVSHVNIASTGPCDSSVLSSGKMYHGVSSPRPRLSLSDVCNAVGSGKRSVWLLPFAGRVCTSSVWWRRRSLSRCTSAGSCICRRFWRVRRVPSARWRPLVIQFMVSCRPLRLVRCIAVTRAHWEAKCGMNAPVCASASEQLQLE